MTSLNKNQVLPKGLIETLVDHIKLSSPFMEDLTLAGQLQHGDTIKFQRYPQLKNQPITIHMAGWESNTHKLQKAGWQVSVEECRDEKAYGMRLRVALKHPGLKLYCITNSIVYDHGDEEWMKHYGKPAMELSVMHLACDMEVITIAGSFSNFRPVNAEPIYSTHTTRQGIEDFKIFQPLPPEKQIIVPQESVGELLTRIEEIQEPYQELLREEKRVAMRKFGREGKDYALATNVIAQVATII